MTLTRSLPYVLALATACASAQVDLVTVRTFVPLEVGDVWEYDYHSEECDHVVYGGACRSQDATYTYRVVGEDVRGGDTLSVVEGPGTRALFGVRADGSGWASEVVDPGDGSAPPLPPFPSFSTFESMVNRGPIPWTFEAGGVEYSAEALTYYPPPYVLARGVGLTEHSGSWQGTGGSRSSYSWELSGASVGGVRYGGLVTSTPSPAATAPVDVSVGPNPTTGLLTVRARLGPVAEARIQIVDALGRQVRSVDVSAAGSSLRATLDVSGLPAGFYVVRLFVDGRPAASTTLTRASAP